MLYRIMNTVKENERVLKALANRRRLAIIVFLKKKPEETVNKIAEHIKLSFTSTSKHLNILARADILDKRQTGLEVYYSIGRSIPSLVEPVIARIL